MSEATHLEQIVEKYAESVSTLEQHVIQMGYAMKALVTILVEKDLIPAEIIEFAEEESRVE